MAKSKIKRYDGEDGSLVSGMDFGGSSGSGEYAPEPEKPQTFKEAFAAARRSGDKTFMFGGKKYTTEVASEKKASTSMKTTTEPAQPKPAPRMAEEPVRTEKPRTYRDFSGKVRTAEPTKQEPSMLSRAFKAIRERGESGPPAYAKGGSVSSASRRADGMAQKGKTKGKYL